jgi:hypothetical protein
MSKEFILKYAKGESNEPACIAVFHIENSNIVIHSCKKIDQKEHVFIHLVYSKEEVGIDVGEKEVMEAAKKKYPDLFSGIK